MPSSKLSTRIGTLVKLSLLGRLKGHLQKSANRL